MTTPAWHPLVTALGNLYSMLTRDRGLETQPVDAAVLSRLADVQKLSIYGSQYADVGDLVFEKNFLDAAHVNEYAANKNNIDWIAEHTRLIMFEPVADQPRVHAGINYTLLFVVVTKRSGEDTTKKMQIAQIAMDRTLKRLGVPHARGRLLRLVCGSAMKEVVKTKVVGDIAIETWFTQELQLEPTQHEDVPQHLVYANMDPRLVAQIPLPLRKLAEREKMKLDVLSPNDIIARWYGFVIGQTICVARHHKLEYGRTYNLRFVR